MKISYTTGRDVTRLAGHAFARSPPNASSTSRICRTIHGCSDEQQHFDAEEATYAAADCGTIRIRRPEDELSDQEWRVITRPNFELASLISEAIAAESMIANNIAALRASPTLLMFSDYGGAHKGAGYEVLSYLVATASGITHFERSRAALRQADLHTRRRMSYKALNDRMRLRALPAYLEAADLIEGVLISFAVDKRAVFRLTESYQPDAAFGTLGQWASRSFEKLSRVGHLCAIVVEGTRGEHQNLIWITDEDEIAPNPAKHTEATTVVSHLLSAYLTEDMGHLRFGTTASDGGDLLIEDLTAVPDLAAGALNEVLTQLAPHPDSSSVARLFLPANSPSPEKVRAIAAWLGRSASTLTKVNIVVDEGPGGCAVRSFAVVTDFADL